MPPASRLEKKWKGFVVRHDVFGSLSLTTVTSSFHASSLPVLLSVSPLAFGPLFSLTPSVSSYVAILLLLIGTARVWRALFPVVLVAPRSAQGHVARFASALDRAHLLVETHDARRSYQICGMTRMRRAGTQSTWRARLRREREAYGVCLPARVEARTWKPWRRE